LDKSYTLEDGTVKEEYIRYKDMADDMKSQTDFVQEWQTEIKNQYEVETADKYTDIERRVFAGSIY
jgi:hypothetical protein